MLRCYMHIKLYLFSFSFRFDYALLVCVCECGIIQTEAKQLSRTESLFQWILCIFVIVVCFNLFSLPLSLSFIFSIMLCSMALRYVWKCSSFRVVHKICHFVVENVQKTCCIQLHCVSIGVLKRAPDKAFQNERMSVIHKYKERHKTEKNHDEIIMTTTTMAATMPIQKKYKRASQMSTVQTIFECNSRTKRNGAQLSATKPETVRKR